MYSRVNVIRRIKSFVVKLYSTMNKTSGFKAGADNEGVDLNAVRIR